MNLRARADADHLTVSGGAHLYALVSLVGAALIAAMGAATLIAGEANGALIVAAGLLAAPACWWSYPSITVELDRRTGEALIVSERLGWRRRKTLPLADRAWARLAEPFSPFARARFVIDGRGPWRSVRFPRLYPRRQIEPAVEAVNDFLAEWRIASQMRRGNGCAHNLVFVEISARRINLCAWKAQKHTSSPHPALAF